MTVRLSTRPAFAGVHTANIHVSRDLKLQYSEIVPVLSGRGDQATITLLGRRRDDPSKLEKIVTQPWKQGEPVKIVWEDPGSVPAN